MDELIQCAVCDQPIDTPAARLGALFLGNLQTEERTIFCSADCLRDYVLESGGSE
jgi:hypothetical protein